MARIYDRVASAITAQASAAITADALSGGSQTAVDRASGQNADGADWLDCYVNVTAAPSGGDATCELYMAGYTGSAYADDGPDDYGEYALSVKIPNGVTGDFRLGPIFAPPEKAQFKLKAVSYGFTASLIVVPHHVADA